MKKFWNIFIIFLILVANILAAIGSCDKATYIIVYAFFTMYFIDKLE